ncbi:importin-9 isoform X2 [Petromyzon marinus]|uniref:Importin-9 isoform X2 n=1 Tax=Petromyzon marinus TaxID=7757 RepID=A0AAJ7U4V1_PETMA|nr:importin-9 isoform X2 [Petromyzon marinus]
MAASAPVQQGLREALMEALTAILSPVQEVRAAGEAQIKVLEVTEEFGVHLAELTVDPHGALAIRQLASVVLKQYVETHWSSHSEKFRPPEAPESAKAAIRQLLPAGLRESLSKVRSTVAYAVSAIAHWDWPDAWPQLFGLLMEMLTGGEVSAVHGAMRVLTEFTREVTDTQMPLVAPVILPEMYRIFTMAEVYSIRTRARAVEIFTVCASLIHAIDEVEKGASKTLLFPVLQQFLEAFIQAMQIPDGPSSDSGLKMEVLKAVTALVKSFPKQMSPSMQQILPIVWNTLTQSATIYVRTEVNFMEEASDPVDSDGEVLGFENLVFSIFEFVHALLEAPRFRGTLRKALPDLIYYLILYAQITEEQVKVWTANPEQFVEDEDDDTLSYSVRISAQDMLLAIMAEFQGDSAAALAAAATRHLQEAEQARNAGSSYWWKLHEACMLALGSVKDAVIDAVRSGKVQFDMDGFLTNVVLADLSSSASPFLLGRALWSASRFASLMTPELVQRFLQATVSGLHDAQPPSVRISAVRAVWGYCDQLKQAGSVQVLRPFLPAVVEALVQLATHFTSDVLTLVMETLCVVCAVDADFTSSVEAKVCPLTIALFLKYSNDPVVASLAEDMFKGLSRIEACQAPLQMRLIPTLVSIMQAPPDKVPQGLCSVALDILSGVVRNTKPPLSDLLMCQAFPAVAQCTLRTEDNAVMQSGGECLRAYVSVALEQVGGWRDDAGRSGLWYVLQAVTRLLDPRSSEFTATFVGRLVSTLVGRLGTQLGDSLDLMLRAVLSKMQQAETLSVMQSLIMVFAHLVHSQLDALLEFLSSLPGPTGKPALEFVMSEWTSRQHLFYGQYEGKVSAMALCKLLQHGVATHDTRLQDLTVRGEQIFSASNAVQTRSKTAQTPERWTVIPLLVKIYKLIINDLSVIMESNASRQASAGGEELDDTWDEVDDDDDEHNEDDDDEDEDAGGQTLSELLGMGAGARYDDDFYEDDEEEDPDAVMDPLYQVDLQAYLTEFLQHFSQQPCFPVFRDHLSEVERRVLQSAGIAM